MTRPPDFKERWRAAMLCSGLSPAQKLLLHLASEEMTPDGDVPFPADELAARLGVAVRTLQDHRTAAQEKGWLSAEPTVAPAATGKDRREPRPIHYAAQIGKPARPSQYVERVRQNRGRFAAVVPHPFPPNERGATAPVNAEEPDNGCGATAPVSIETPDQDDAVATGAHPGRDERGDENSPGDEGEDSERKLADLTRPRPHFLSLRSSLNGSAVAAPDRPAEVVASRGDHKRGSEGASGDGKVAGLPTEWDGRSALWRALHPDEGRASE
jgi:hypothetical protein